MTTSAKASGGTTSPASRPRPTRSAPALPHDRDRPTSYAPLSGGWPRSHSCPEFGSPIAGAARWFLDYFEGSFDCEVTTDGTLVTHREAYRFKRPWRWLAEPLLRRWLERDTAAEMVRFKSLLGRS
jgi:hypothetical protein